MRETSTSRCLRLLGRHVDCRSRHKRQRVRVARWHRLFRRKGNLSFLWWYHGISWDTVPWLSSASHSTHRPDRVGELSRPVHVASSLCTLSSSWLCKGGKFWDIGNSTLLRSEQVLYQSTRNCDKCLRYVDGMGSVRAYPLHIAIACTRTKPENFWPLPNGHKSVRSRFFKSICFSYQCCCDLSSVLFVSRCGNLMRLTNIQDKLLYPNICNNQCDASACGAVILKRIPICWNRPIGDRFLGACLLHIIYLTTRILQGLADYYGGSN